jgi:membrane protein YqaA with SNARE-associated domain
LIFARSPIAKPWLLIARRGVSTFLAPSTTKSSGHLLRWLIHLGALGIFAVAVVDSSMIPIPLPGSTDFLLLLLTAFHSSSIASPVIYASCAFAGSVVGGYMTWATGKKGGETALEKLGKGRLVGSIQRWVKRNGMVSVAFAALLPPPIPLLPFLLAAGALGLSRARFLVSYCASRAVRYGFVGWLGYKYGRQVIVFWQTDLKGWTTPILTVYFGLIVVGATYGIWKYRKDRRKGK